MCVDSAENAPGAGTACAGIALRIEESSDLRLGDGSIEGFEVGVLLRASRDVDVTGHSIAACAQGIVLEDMRAGLRFEGNLIAENDTGLSVAEQPDASPEESANPVLANNTFRANRILDIDNRSSTPLHAAGNWWGDGGASVSGVVLLESSAWLGTVAVATARGAADEILGRLLQRHVEDAGYRAIDLIGIGTDEVLARALRAGDADIVWWSSSGGDVTEILPDDVYAIESGASEGWIAVAADAWIEELGGPDLSGLFASVQTDSDRIRIVAPPEFENEIYSALVSTYAASPLAATITRVRDTAEAEAMLKLGGADVAIVDGLVETLTRGAFSALEDSQGVLGGSPLVLVCRSELLERLPGLADELARLAEGLSTELLHEMVSRVRLFGDDPESVAKSYLHAVVGDDE